MERTMRFQRANWLFPGLILAAQIILLVISPEERTLGVGIKPVYLHVSLTWTGMLLLALAGLIGVLVTLSANKNQSSWLNTIFNVALLFYGAGFIVSMVASVINWGGIPFSEPRVLTALNILVVAAVVWVLVRWIPRRRIRGIVSTFPVVFMVWTVESSRVMLHPDNPVNSSPGGIRFAFYGMFFLAVLLAGWFVGFYRNRENLE